MNAFFTFVVLYNLLVGYLFYMSFAVKPPVNVIESNHVVVGDKPLGHGFILISSGIENRIEGNFNSGTPILPLHLRRAQQKTLR